MKAKEANAIKPIPNVKEYERIIQKIEIASLNGEKRLLVYENNKLSKALIEKLVDDGYDVTSETDRDGYLGIIDWSNAK